MHILKIDKKENSLLERTELSVELLFEGATPGRGQIIENLATELKAKKELIVVRHIISRFGEPRANVEACIYSSLEGLKKFESSVFTERAIPKKERHEKAQAKKQPNQETEQKK